MEEEIILGDETEEPSSAETESSAENESGNEPGDNSEPPPVEEAPKGLGSAFEQAKAKALAAKTFKAEAPQAKETENADDPEEDSAADEKVPAKEDESVDPAKKVSEADAETAKTKRGEKFKEVVAERDAATERVANFEKQFEKHGGLETVETAIELFDKLASGQVMEVLSELPKKDRETAYRAVFENALTDENNRIYGVNSILKNEFGLTQDLPKAMIEKIFEFATLKINEDMADFEALIDRELEYADTPERKLARAESLIEQLKQKPEEKDAPAAEETLGETEDVFALQQRIENTYNEFEDTLAARIGAQKFAAFGLAPVATDTPAVKEAKELLMRALKHDVGVELRTAKSFEPLLKHWVEGDTKSVWYRQAADAYERSMSLKYEKNLKAISRLLGATAKPQPTGKKITDLAHGKTQNKINPSKQPEKSGGFGTAFSAAKKSTQA